MSQDVIRRHQMSCDIMRCHKMSWNKHIADPLKQSQGSVNLRRSLRPCPLPEVLPMSKWAERRIFGDSSREVHRSRILHEAEGGKKRWPIALNTLVYAYCASQCSSEQPHTWRNAICWCLILFVPVAISSGQIALSRHISFQHGRRSTSTAASRQQVREGAGLVLKFFLVIPFLCRLCRRLWTFESPLHCLPSASAARRLPLRLHWSALEVVRRGAYFAWWDRS